MNEVLITTNGAGRRQAWYEVDGANSVDIWGRQTIFTNIPLMAVDEMSVLANAFTPAYGGGTGSVVNIVTRSGGSNYHGQLLELWRPAATEASLSGFTTTNAASGNDITSAPSARPHSPSPAPSCRRRRSSSLPANGTAKPKPCPSRRHSRPASLSATIAAGSVCCASITRSTTRTMRSFAPISTTLLTQILMGSLAA